VKDRRTEIIPTRFAPDEVDALDRAAADARISRSELIRTLVLGAIEQDMASALILLARLPRD